MVALIAKPSVLLRGKYLDWQNTGWGTLCGLDLLCHLASLPPEIHLEATEQTAQGSCRKCCLTGHMLDVTCCVSQRLLGCKGLTGTTISLSWPPALHAMPSVTAKPPLKLPTSPSAWPWSGPRPSFHAHHCCFHSWSEHNCSHLLGCEHRVWNQRALHSTSGFTLTCWVLRLVPVCESLKKSFRKKWLFDVKSKVPGPQAKALPGGLEMQNLRPCSRPTETGCTSWHSPQLIHMHLRIWEALVELIHLFWNQWHQVCACLATGLAYYRCSNKMRYFLLCPSVLECKTSEARAMSHFSWDR